jgi:hypothetical protein
MIGVSFSYGVTVTTTTATHQIRQHCGGEGVDRGDEDWSVASSTLGSLIKFALTATMISSSSAFVLSNDDDQLPLSAGGARSRSHALARAEDVRRPGLQRSLGDGLRVCVAGGGKAG